MIIPNGIKILSKTPKMLPTNGNQNGAVINRNTIAANSIRKIHLFFICYLTSQNSKKNIQILFY